MTFTNDPLEKRLSTVGRILPHTSAKIIDRAGKIVPLGERGELCVAGYALQKGYWNDPAKTAEAMRVDDHGVRWMHTGDEAIFDEEGYCTITGRIKDIIIRGKSRWVSQLSPERWREYISSRGGVTSRPAPSSLPSSCCRATRRQIWRDSRCFSHSSRLAKPANRR